MMMNEMVMNQYPMYAPPAYSFNEVVMMAPTAPKPKPAHKVINVGALTNSGTNSTTNVGSSMTSAPINVGTATNSGYGSVVNIGLQDLYFNN